MGSHPQVKPFGLLKILKGANGLTWAPRLWCLKARSLLESIGAVELKVARVVFVFGGNRKDGLAGLIAILSLYVDDVLVFGAPKDPRFKEIKGRQADSVFNIEHWKDFGWRAGKYLGMQWQTMQEHASSLCIHTDEYIDGLKGTGIKSRSVPERPLNTESLALYRGTLAKARWPANRVAPDDLLRRSVCPRTWCQGPEWHVLFADGPRRDRRTCPREIGEFESNTIHRVARSTMAAESPALSKSFDRQLYLRLV